MKKRPLVFITILLMAMSSVQHSFANDAELDAIALAAQEADNDTELLALVGKSCMSSFENSQACKCFTLAIASTVPTVPQLRKLADHFGVDRMREYAKSKAPMSESVMQRLGICFQ